MAITPREPSRCRTPDVGIGVGELSSVMAATVGTEAEIDLKRLQVTGVLQVDFRFGVVR